MSPRTLRSAHRLVALLSAALVAITVGTGLLWAFAPYLYWSEGYLQRKRPIEGPPLDSVAVPARQALEIAKQRGSTGALAELRLRRDAGRLWWEARGDDVAGESAILIDARTGEVHSPLDGDAAGRFARAYVAPPSNPESVELLPAWTHRKARHPRPAWRVEFDDARGTTIFVDAASGEILEEEDAVRRFHFFVMDLHQMKFFGTHKELTALSGVPLLFLLATGLAISRRRRRRS